jgi:hypothetical protein
MILTDHSWLHIEQPRKMEMLFNHIGRWHCILDEAFDVKEQTILVLVQIVEANGTLQLTHDSRKSDGADGAIVSTAYTITTMHTHTRFSINFRWSTIMSILSLSTATSGTTWTVVGGEGIGGICSIMSSHWKNWQPLAWNIRLTTHNLALNHEAN